MKLVIVDVGCGNVGSIAIAAERCGVSAELSDDADTIASADKVILPGVGAAGHAMRQIDGRGLADVLRSLRQPVLGICLGMQLLFEWSEEETTQCLGILPGKVRRLAAKPDMPVPHMGWSRLSVADETIGLQSGDYVYFAHSYACEANAHAIATADYGRLIPAAVRKDNFLGAQFHPERSGAAGARFLKAFLSQ